MRRSSKAPTVPALDAGLRLIARRAHSRHELRLKLGRRGYDRAEVEAAVARLLEMGLLDDGSFAAGHVRRRSTSVGPLALSAELASRGVERSTAAAALDRFDRSAQLASAERLGRRLAGTRSYAGYKELLDRVGPKLVRRGFSPGIARLACDALWSGTESSRPA